VSADASSPATKRVLALPHGNAPMLLTVIHTEEEFDWSAPFNRASVGVTHLRDLGRVQEIFARYGAKATYVLDYPVVSQESGVTAIKAAIQDQPVTIGAHLHPWVNPPFTEAVSTFHSYPGNLPVQLELEKLARLTDSITAAFGFRPRTYLAGRYGFGPHTLSILQELGYDIDLSAVAISDFRSDGGPDYRQLANASFWEGEPAILRVPHSVGDIGYLCRNGRRFFDFTSSEIANALHLPSVLARSRAVERVRLTPEGFSLRHLKSVTRALVKAGVRILLFSFHSPSVTPGHTPYVRDRAELQMFLERIDGFLKFFQSEVGGIFVTPDDLLRGAVS
jgi:hypothetical protein